MILLPFFPLKMGVTWAGSPTVRGSSPATSWGPASSLLSHLRDFPDDRSLMRGYYLVSVDWVRGATSGLFFGRQRREPFPLRCPLPRKSLKKISASENDGLKACRP